MDYEANLFSTSLSNQYKQLFEYYHRRQYCDLQIQCYGEVGSISCHRLVLANISRSMKCYLESVKFQDSVTLILPSCCRYNDLKAFLDALYLGLADNNNISFPDQCQEVAFCFDIGKKITGQSSLVEPSLSEDDFNFSYMNKVDDDDENEMDYNMDNDFGDSEDESYSENNREGTQLMADRILPDDQDSRTTQQDPSSYSLRNSSRVKKPSLNKESSQTQEKAKSLSGKSVRKDVRTQKYQTIQQYLTGNEEDLPTLNPLDINLSLESDCSGVVENVKYFHPPYMGNISLEDILTSINVSLQIVVGLQEIPQEKNSYKAKPLAWTGAEYNMLVTQFNCYKEFIRNSIGVSEGDILLQPAMMEHAEGFNSKKRHSLESLKVKYRKEPEDQYKDMLKSWEKRYEHLTYCPSKSIPEPLEENIGKTFKFTSDMDSQACQNVILLVATDFGVFGFPIVTSKMSTKEVKKVCSQTLFDVWHNNRRAEFHHHHYFTEQCIKAIEVMQSIKALKTLLKKPDIFVCEDCGWEKQVITENDKATFKKHVRRHKMEKEDCGCNISFDTLKSKRIHMLLKHSNLDRVKCDYCDTVATTKQIAKHMDFSHKIKNIVCDVCGRMCKKEADLVAHHNKSHKVFTCNSCKESFVGTLKYKNHLREAHGKNIPLYVAKPGQCQECDFVCNNGSALKYHVLRMHTPNDKKPHQCEKCGKGYSCTQHLSRHRKTCFQ